MLGEWPERGGAGLKTEKNRPVGRRCGKTAELCSCLWRLLGGAQELCLLLGFSFQLNRELLHEVLVVLLGYANVWNPDVLAIGDLVADALLGNLTTACYLVSNANSGSTLVNSVV